MDSKKGQRIVKKRTVSRLGAMLVAVNAVVAFPTTPIAAEEAGEVAVVGELASRIGAQAPGLRDRTKFPPLGFPGLLLPQSTNGLRLKSLKVGGAPGKHEVTRPSVEFRAEFVWGRHDTAQQDWDSPIEIFFITFNETSQEQKMHSSRPTLRVPSKNPSRATVSGTFELSTTSEGCWTTIIIVGRDSASEPVRLLACRTQFVSFLPADKVGRKGDERQKKDGGAENAQK